jgi:hypothetical protein
MQKEWREHKQNLAFGKLAAKMREARKLSLQFPGAQRFNPENPLRCLLRRSN